MYIYQHKFTGQVIKLKYPLDKLVDSGYWKMLSGETLKKQEPKGKKKK